MAEGFSRTIQAGSDAVIEVTCTPCDEDGVKEVAVNFCPACDQYLCTACSKCHARFPATKGHVVKYLQSREKAGKVCRTQLVAKCPVHPDRNIEMYCGQHKMVYCALCVAKEHRTCTGIKEVNDSIEPIMKHTEIQALVAEIDSLAAKFEVSKRRKQDNIKTLGEKEKEFVAKINDVCTALIQHVDHLRETALTSIASKREELTSEIKEEITRADEMEKNLQECKKQTSSQTNVSQGQNFIQQVLGQNTVSEAGSLLSKLDSYEGKQIELEVNKALQDSVLGETHIAQPKPKVVQRGLGATHIAQPKPKAIQRKEAPVQLPMVKDIQDVNVRLPDDWEICNITGITQLPNNSIIICDLNNGRLKRLTDTWKVRDYCELDSPPWGVCCTGETGVAVKLYNDSVQFVTVGATLTKTRKISITGGNILGIECILGQLWVSQRSSVKVYSMSGSLLKEHGGIEGLSQELTACNETVYITNDRTEIVRVDRDGSVNTFASDERLQGSSGLCVIRNNIICATGLNSNNIVMFGKDGTCIGELVRAQQGIQKPWALCYDKKNDAVIVGCEDTDIIKVIKL